MAMEMSSVTVFEHHSPCFIGAAGDHNQDVSPSTTPDPYSSLTSSSASSQQLAASPAGSQQPVGGIGGAAITVTVEGGSSGAAIVVTVDGDGPRAKALKSLKESIPHTMKLRSLQNSDRKYQQEGSWHKKSVRRLSKELYVIVSWYALLQSALYAAVAQTNIFKCDDWWGPIGMAAMVTVGTVMCAVDKLCRIGEQKQEVSLFQARQNAVYDNIEKLNRYGSACDLDSLEPDSGLAPSANPGFLFVSSVHGNLVLGFLVGFSGLIIFSCLRMLCDPSCECSSL